MKKTYKIVPFDIELAKKIQAGEIEGKIKTKCGNGVRILCFDLIDPRDVSFPIVCALYNDKSVRVVRFTEYGRYSGAIGSELDIVIELPEEAPKQYPYDRVKDKITDADREEAKKTFPDSGNMQSAFIEGIAYQICKEIDCKKVPTHEFKSFDKVLVTQDGWNYWIPSLYRNETPDGKHICIDNLEYDYCIPYEGNEHLVGTTDKPKEE